MNRKERHHQIQGVALTLILFTFPYRPLLVNNLCIIVLILNWVVQGDFRTKLALLAKNKIALLYTGLFFLHLLSYFFSEDKGRAATVLEQNLFIFIVPIVLATSNFTGGQINKAFYGLVLGCLLGVGLSLVNSFYTFSITGETHHFFYHDLSKPILGIHAVYFSLYISFCILFLTFELKSKWRSLKAQRRTLYFLSLAILLGSLILLSSKTIIVGSLIALNILFAIWFIDQSKLVSRYLGIIIINVCVVIAVLKIDYVKARFIDSINSNIEIIRNDTYSELTVFTGVTVRLTFWKFIVEILNENDAWITGMSIGDGQNALHDKAVKKGLFGGNKERGWTDYTDYNAHNQFFQYLLLLGIVGVVYFLILLCSMAWRGVKQKNAFVLLVLFLFVLFCFTESVLVRNKGIVFFVFIPPLLLHSALQAGTRNSLVNTHLD